MRDLYLLIKPVSSACNMQCSYCFYKDEASKREIYSYGKMTEEIEEEIVKKAFQAARRSCTFGFQGGEPTLAGLEFFKNFVRYVKQYNTKKIAVEYSLQTNGLLLEKEWLDFLQEHHFLVGISLDGPKAIHDQNRLDGDQKGSFSRVIQVISAMQKRKISVNVLTVLTGQSVRHVEKIYRFLKRNGVYYHQYLPCLDPLGEERGKKIYSLTPDLFADGLKRLFDLWYEDLIRGDYVYIRQFENWVGILKGHPPEACAMYGRCSMQNVIEGNGDVFPCDFYALDPYCMGNIWETDFEELQKNTETQAFFRQAQKRGEKCPDCKWYPLCRGGCKRDCEKDSDGNYSNYFCQSYQEFFAYAIQRLEWLASC